MSGRIEESVWLDPHIGGDHAFVEWVRVVVDEQTLLATAEGAGSPMEAWRPLLEDTCSNAGRKPPVATKNLLGGTDGLRRRP